MHGCFVCGLSLYAQLSQVPHPRLTPETLLADAPVHSSYFLETMKVYVHQHVVAGAVNKCDLWQMSDPFRAQDEAEDLNSRVGALRCHGATQGRAYCQRYLDQAFLLVASGYSKKVHSHRKRERTLTR